MRIVRPLERIGDLYKITELEGTAVLFNTGLTLKPTLQYVLEVQTGGF